MSIGDHIRELRELETEIKRLRARVRTLCSQKERCEVFIQGYLKEQNQPGIKMDGMIVLAEEKTRRKPKKKSERISSGVSVLERYGVSHPHEVLEELLESIRGDAELQEGIKIYEK